jgi:glycosyltransferase involved in cell wall biosynthesis
MGSKKETDNRPRVLIASPVHNRAWVLPEFLECIKSLDTTDLEVDYYFFCNDCTDNSADILRQWNNGNVHVAHISIDLPVYQRNMSHITDMYTRLKIVRDTIRKHAVDNGFDYLFCVDSDTLVQPDTLKKLLAHDKPFVAAMCSNTPDGSFRYVNAAGLTPPTEGPYGDPPRWYMWVPQGKGLETVGATGACYLVTRNVMEQCAYDYQPFSEANKKLMKDQPGEDMAFALSCRSAGYFQYLDETALVHHCYTPELLEQYREAARKNKKQAVRIVTQRAWLGIDPSKRISAGG